MNQETLHPTAAPIALVDRRRPGRTDVAPELLPLLRVADLPPVIKDDRDWSTLENEDAMAPARGITIGLLLAIPFWTIIGTAGYFVFR